MAQVRSIFAIGLVVLLCLAASELPARQAPTSATSAKVQFRDIARAAGVAVRHVNGASPDKYFAEIMGSGGLFFDFDDDGWLDIFLVDGGSIASPKVAATARHRLLRNRGAGASMATNGITFEDVSAQSGITHREYGMGACAGDYDNDGNVDLYVTNYAPEHPLSQRRRRCLHRRQRLVWHRRPSRQRSRDHRHRLRCRRLA
jgi:hypothetical protein